MKNTFFASLKSKNKGVGPGVGSESGYISQRYGSGDPDPQQIIMDPQHCLLRLKETMRVSSAPTAVCTRICKLFRSPGIDSKELIPPAYVALQAVTTKRAHSKFTNVGPGIFLDGLSSFSQSFSRSF
jgi:hypothetical protein